MAGPDVEPRPDGYRVRWPALAVQFDFEQLHFIRGGMHGGLWGQVAVTSIGSAAHGLLEETHLNLTSLTGRATLAKALNGCAEDVDWPQVIKQSCVAVLHQHREGQPFVHLAVEGEPPERLFTVHKLVQAEQLTIFYGDKDSGKSIMALASGYAVADGSDSLLGLAVLPVKVMYLDWETDKATQAERLAWLARGVGAHEVPDIIYRRMEAPLVDDISPIRREIADAQVGLVIIDSVGFACGAQLKEAEGALAFYRAQRGLGCTVLAVAQTRKAEVGEHKRHFSVYGSTFFEYAARSIWRVQAQREAESPRLNVGLFHEKANNTIKWKPLGYRIDFEQQEKWITLTPMGVRGVPELAEGLPLMEQIQAVLRSGAKDAQEIADDLGAQAGTVRVILARYKNAFVKVGGKWALLSQHT